MQNPKFVGYDPQDEFFTNPWCIDRRAGEFVPDDGDHDEEAGEEAEDEDDNDEEAGAEAEDGGDDGDETIGTQVIEHLPGGEADAEGFPDSDYEADVQPYPARDLIVAMANTGVAAPPLQAEGNSGVATPPTLYNSGFTPQIPQSLPHALLERDRPSRHKL